MYRNCRKYVISTQSSELELLLISAILVLALGVFSGCTEEVGSPCDPKPEGAYDDWLTYRYENFVILYPPKHPNESGLESIGTNYINCIDRVVTDLRMSPLTDCILFVYYTGYGSGREMTGRQYPFATDTAIHFWLPSFPGPVLMQYLLPLWVPGEPHYRFLKHGLISLYDFSGQAYHEFTVGYINKDRFIKLADLAADTTVNSNTERHQSAEAASFCAFVMGQFGADTLKALYQSSEPFDQAVPALFGMSVEALENYWLRYVRASVPADSIVDSLWD
ncbi:MAG: hypothetical protein JSU65_08210 [Candidatus Zixiibacteriota bacterium]|nr:MAG: hypothetical protein JSU65_08210 [candidate division Zixibacteria bacterium]